MSPLNFSGPSAALRPGRIRVWEWTCAAACSVQGKGKRAVSLRVARIKLGFCTVLGVCLDSRVGSRCWEFHLAGCYKERGKANRPLMGGRFCFLCLAGTARDSAHFQSCGHLL